MTVASCKPSLDGVERCTFHVLQGTIEGFEEEISNTPHTTLILDSFWTPTLFVVCRAEVVAILILRFPVTVFGATIHLDLRLLDLWWWLRC